MQTVIICARRAWYLRVVGHKKDIGSDQHPPILPIIARMGFLVQVTDLSGNPILIRRCGIPLPSFAASGKLATRVFVKTEVYLCIWSCRSTTRAVPDCHSSEYTIHVSA